MSGHCPRCGTYHEEDDDRVCSKCASSSEPTPAPPRREKPWPEHYVAPQIRVMDGLAEQIGGLTLRDYFAGQAVVGLIGVMEANDEQLATAAYEIADAMMLVSKGGGAW